MKTYKIIDLWTSIGLIISFAILTLLNGNGSITNDKLFVGYFVVGGWQVISMLVHTFTRTFTYGARVVYHWITLIAVATMPAGSFWILWIAAPFMAVFYTWLCYREVYIKMKRPLDLLK